MIELEEEWVMIDAGERADVQVASSIRLRGSCRTTREKGRRIVGRSDTTIVADAGDGASDWSEDTCSGMQKKMEKKERKVL